jgi:uncharacterized protein YhfF
MTRINNNPVSVKEFEAYTRKIVNALEEDSSGFFTVIRDTFDYFTSSDTIIETTQVSLEEFEAITREITKILGKEDSVRFFKAVYDALPKKTIKYLGVIVKMFEEIFN